MSKDLIERLQSHMGMQDMGIVLADCREAATLLERQAKLLEDARAVIQWALGERDSGHFTAGTSLDLARATLKEIEALPA